MDLKTILNVRAVLALLPESRQQSIKATARKLRSRAYRAMYAYDANELEAKLRSLGIGSGDAVLMQSAFSELNGFLGEAIDVIDCVSRIVGADGHLFMMSMPYGGSAREYLQTGTPFNVRRTPSQMGLISELFRRRNGVMRSANPMHPVLALGPRAEWIIGGHEDLAHSCGEQSPFERMLDLDTKALLFDVDLDVLTFTHYLEHSFQDSAPAPVYDEHPIAAEIIDRRGAHRRVLMYPFSVEAMRLRNFGVLYDELISGGFVRSGKIGNTTLRVVRLRDVLSCGRDLVARGTHIFAKPGEPTRIKPKNSLR